MSIVVDNIMVTFKEFLVSDPAEVNKFVEELYGHHEDDERVVHKVFSNFIRITCAETGDCLEISTSGNITAESYYVNFNKLNDAMSKRNLIFN